MLSLSDLAGLPFRPHYWVLNALSILLVGGYQPTWSQQTPDSAHVNLYFPFVRYGGPSWDHWNIAVILSNPSTLENEATVNLHFFGENGKPLEILINGSADPSSSTVVKLPPLHTKALNIIDGPPTSVNGWLYAYSTSPTSAHMYLTNIRDSQVVSTIGVQPTVPAFNHTFQVQHDSRISIANIFGDVPITVPMALVSSNGIPISSLDINLPPAAQKSYIISEIFSIDESPFLGLAVIGPSSVRGSQCPECPLRVADIRPHVASGTSLESSESPISLPRGNLAFPRSHRDEIWFVFHSIANIAKPFVGEPAVRLRILNDQTVNAYARGGMEVGFSMGLAELIGDSRSEVASVIGHEFGHIYQQRFNSYQFDSNREHDANFWGLLLGLFAGFDPYGAAGALAKLSMATGRSSLADQFFEDIPVADAHQSFNTRLSKLFDKISYLCSGAAHEQCQEYKTLIHPASPRCCSVVRNSGVGT